MPLCPLSEHWKRLCRRSLDPLGRRYLQILPGPDGSLITKSRTAPYVARSLAFSYENTIAGKLTCPEMFQGSETHDIRKCGRVVCNSCSPHRIIIPHQYIVRPPGSDTSMHQSLLIDGLGAGYFDVNDMSGGERVRLCNPCVPDPNTAPPQSPSPQATLSPRSAHHRSRSSIGTAYGTLPPSNRHGAVFAPGASGDPYRYLSPRMRSVTMVSGP